MSIKKFYPLIRIIIADHTPNDEFEEVDLLRHSLVSQYKITDSEGLFDGRTLAISQVTTDFFVWVDDDFVLSIKTDLQYMLDVITSNGNIKPF